MYLHTYFKNDDKKSHISHVKLQINLTKNDNIHKSKVKKTDNQTNIDKHRVAANITEYHIISKLIFLRIIIPKCRTDPNYIKSFAFNKLFLAPRGELFMRGSSNLYFFK